MARKRFTAEQIILKLREAEVSLAQGKAVGQVCKQMGVTEQSDYRWRKEYGGLTMDQVKRLKALDPAGDFCTSESERESHGGGQDRCQCRGTNRNRS